jgi:glutathione peroxidase
MKRLSTSLALAAMLLTSALAADPALYDIALKDIEGKATTLKAYEGKVLLVVNVASQCGATPQYEKLERLYQVGKAKGLVVCGFPCNDFGAQEPGTASEIKSFCSTTYSVTFPLFEKIAILGDAPHPLYAALTGKDSPKPGPVGWNFTKFLISREGKIIDRFDTSVEPDAPEVLTAIEKALEK